MHRELVADLSLRVGVTEHRLPSFPRSNSSPSLLEEIGMASSISRMVITRVAPFFPTSFVLLLAPLPGYTWATGPGETRNYESVHDRTNRMPRRFGPLRILINVVIKFFVVLRAHGRTRY